MDHIGDSLNKRLNQRSLSTTAQAAYVCHVANELANGRFVARSFARGTLTLTTPSAGAAHNLSFEKSQLLQQINEKIGNQQITKIVVRVDSPTQPDSWEQ